MGGILYFIPSLSFLTDQNFLHRRWNSFSFFSLHHVVASVVSPGIWSSCLGWTKQEACFPNYVGCLEEEGKRLSRGVYKVWTDVSEWCCIEHCACIVLLKHYQTLRNSSCQPQFTYKKISWTLVFLLAIKPSSYFNFLYVPFENFTTVQNYLLQRLKPSEMQSGLYWEIRPKVRPPLEARPTQIANVVSVHWTSASFYNSLFFPYSLPLLTFH